MRRTRTVIMNQLALAAPWISLLALILLPMWLPARVKLTQEEQARREEVTRKLRNLPELAGRWESREEPAPPPAQKLLRANAVVSRTYRYDRDLKPWVHLLAVHSGDRRDMLAHYPPMCYPNSGWLGARAAEPTELRLKVRSADGREQELPVMTYHYRSLQDQGSEEGIRIFCTFVLPDGGVTAKKDDMERQASPAATAKGGVAQVQLITSSDVEFSEAVNAVEDLLSRMPELMDALAAGKGHGT